MGKNIQGAPDLVIEITSENSVYRDMVQKKLYARSGVKEYWIVIPEEKEIEVHILESPSLRFENRIKRDILR